MKIISSIAFGLFASAAFSFGSISTATVYHGCADKAAECDKGSCGKKKDCKDSDCDKDDDCKKEKKGCSCSAKCDKKEA